VIDFWEDQLLDLPCFGVDAQHRSKSQKNVAGDNVKSAAVRSDIQMIGIQGGTLKLIGQIPVQ